MRFLIILLVSFFVNQCNNEPRSSKQTTNQRKSYRIISYNVENLFDTTDDEGTEDYDFLPHGAYYWTQERYKTKINNIGKVLVNASAKQNPAIIGLIEVENRMVLENLLNNSPLANFPYSIVHEDSPDERGIDVALLYDANQFKFIGYETVEVQFPNNSEDKTRDILLVKGKLNNETVFAIVNHWPSRRGGESVSAPKRIYVASLLKTIVRKIIKDESEAGIIIMGDFNDTPTNTSIQTALGAKSFKEQDTLINLMTPFEEEGRGTYKYQNQWNLLDQFIISRNLTDGKGHLLVTNESASIFSPDWLRENDPNYPGDRLYRTYLGPRYIGGYSDHFPIVLDVFVQ